MLAKSTPDHGARRAFVVDAVRCFLAPDGQ